MAHFRPGDVIAGEYQVEAELGEGGMARVYRCLDLGLHVSVAIKVLKRDFALIPDVCARFLQEARTQARLRHRNIMPVQRVLHQGELAAMVMPYQPGHGLADHIDRAPGGALPEAEALRIFGALLSAVRCAHESIPSVIHRDIKPDNVYLADTPTGRQVLLMDFGIAKVREDSAVRTQTGTRMGTVAYMAPEQILASKDVGVAADVWSLGVVLYELLCGRRPFESDSDLMLPAVVVAAQVPEDPLRGVSGNLRALIHRCLQKEPGARYSSVAGLERATAHMDRELEPPPPPETPGPGPASGKRTVVLAALALLLALGAVGSWLALRSGSRRRAAGALHAASATSSTPAEAAPKPALPPPPVLQSIEWVDLPGGRLAMGSESGASDEKPLHHVRVAPFGMMRSEVTVGMYRTCVGAGMCSADGLLDARWGGKARPDSSKYCNWRHSGREDHPVNCIDWSQAVAFCSVAGGRLPSEAEWEHAASGGEGREYPWSSVEATCALAVMDDGGSGCGVERTWPACARAAGRGRFGVCDLAGNVWEWTLDCWHGSYGGAPTDGSGWVTGCDQGARRVVRGGSWYDGAGELRAANRGWYDAGDRSGTLGFRCVRSASQP